MQHPPLIRRVNPCRSGAGLTAIELLVTIAIVAILAGVAAPSFRQMISKQRMNSASSAVTESLWIARGEALKHNDNASFKFVDINHDWDVVTGTTGVTSATVASLHHEDGQKTITSSGGSGVFVFNAYGRLSSGGGTSIQFNDTGAGLVRCITVSSTGRATQKDSAC